jgi:DNA-binding protein YbaB
MSELYERGRFKAGDVDAALAALAEERRRLEELQEKVAETSTVVHSKDRVLSATFDGRGELNTLTFNGTKYRRLAPAELAAMIKDTLAAGRSQALEKLGSMMGTVVLPGVKFGVMASGQVVMHQVIDSLLGSALGALPDKLRDKAQARLRGEL